MKDLIKYALKNTKLVHISEVESGKKCGCICTKCGTSLIANKGKVKQYYFSHQSNEECKGAVESNIHKLAKNVLLKYKKLLVPEFSVKENNISISTKKQLIEFDEIQLEKRIKIDKSYIQPDAVGIIQGKELYIEFVYSNAVSENKVKLIQKLNKPCLEVYIEFIELTDKKDEDISLINHLLVNDKNCKFWICNPEKELELKEQIRLKSISKIELKKNKTSLDKKNSLVKNTVSYIDNWRTEQEKIGVRFLKIYGKIKKYSHREFDNRFVYCPNPELPQEKSNIEDCKAYCSFFHKITPTYKNEKGNRRDLICKCMERNNF
ncbi:MAG: competence protein CoiA family protein [Flavobacteriales bacterium]